MATLYQGSNLDTTQSLKVSPHLWQLKYFAIPPSPKWKWYSKKKKKKNEANRHFFCWKFEKMDFLKKKITHWWGAKMGISHKKNWMDYQILWTSWQGVVVSVAWWDRVWLRSLPFGFFPKRSAWQMWFITDGCPIFNRWRGIKPKKNWFTIRQISAVLSARFWLTCRPRSRRLLWLTREPA